MGNLLKCWNDFAVKKKAISNQVKLKLELRKCIQQSYRGGWIFEKSVTIVIVKKRKKKNRTPADCVFLDRNFFKTDFDVLLDIHLHWEKLWHSNKKKLAAYFDRHRMRHAASPRSEFHCLIVQTSRHHYWRHDPRPENFSSSQFARKLCNKSFNSSRTKYTWMCNSSSTRKCFNHFDIIEVFRTRITMLFDVVGEIITNCITRWSRREEKKMF